MKTSCPACGATASLDVLLGNEGAREAVMAALAMPAPIGKLLIQYLGLFRPEKRQLSFDKVARILNDLNPMIDAAKIEHRGQIHSAPQDYWRQGIDTIFAMRAAGTLRLPLKDNRLLMAIVCNISTDSAKKQEAQVEHQRAGRTPVGGNRLPSVDEVLGKPQPEKPRGKIPVSLRDALKSTQGE